MEMHQGSVLLPFYSCGRCCHWFRKEGVLSELLYADDSVLTSETLEALHNRLSNVRRQLRASV